MKHLTTICIISGIVSYLLMNSCSKKVYFDSRTATKKDYIIRNQKVNFYFNDSVYPYLAVIKPNGEFYIQKDKSDSLDSKKIWHSAYDNTVYTERYIMKNDSIIELYSYFPLLIIHDSSVINHYGHPEDYDFNLVYEPKYSYLLHLMNEPILSSEKDVQEIRITSLDESLVFLAKPKTHFTLRLKMLNKNSQLFLTEGVFDSLEIFNITRKDSCIIKDRDILKISKAILKIDFKEEYYFAELGLDISDKFLFEYKNENEYYVLERAIFNRYNHKANVQGVYFLLLTMKDTYFKKK